MKRYWKLLAITALVIPVAVVMAACGGKKPLEGVYEVESFTINSTTFVTGDFTHTKAKTTPTPVAAKTVLNTDGTKKVADLYNKFTSNSKGEGVKDIIRTAHEPIVTAAMQAEYATFVTAFEATFKDTIETMLGTAGATDPRASAAILAATVTIAKNTYNDANVTGADTYKAQIKAAKSTIQSVIDGIAKKSNASGRIEFLTIKDDSGTYSWDKAEDYDKTLKSITDAVKVYNVDGRTTPGATNAEVDAAYTKDVLTPMVEGFAYEFFNTYDDDRVTLTIEKDEEGLYFVDGAIVESDDLDFSEPIYIHGNKLSLNEKHSDKKADNCDFADWNSKKGLISREDTMDLMGGTGDDEANVTIKVTFSRIGDVEDEE